MAIDSGIDGDNLESMKPGRVHMARWLQMAEENPTDELRLIVQFIINVYIPAWFGIKETPSFVHGARHLFQIIRLTREHTPELLNDIILTIETNFYFAHSESVLIGMLTDDDVNIRKKAFDLIFQLRKRQPTQNVRQFSKPNINYQCDHYSELIELNARDIYEPPCISLMSLKELKVYYRNGRKINVPSIPLHSQATENCVQIV